MDALQESESSSSRRRGVRRRLLAERQFRYVFGALLGSGMANGFLPVAESFGVLKVTGSPDDLGAVLAVQAATSLSLSLFAGVAADRLPRTRVLMASALTRLAAAGALAAALLTGVASLPWFFVVAVVYGGADALFSPTSTAIVPDVVAPDDLGEANGLIGSFSSMTWTVAPALAGVLVSAFGPGTAFLADAALMVGTTVCLVLARIPAASAEDEPEMPGGIGAQLRQGWQEFRLRRWLWLLTVQWTLFSLVLLAPLAVLGPTVAKQHLGGAKAWGLISTCLTVGIVGSQFLAGRLNVRRPVVFIAWLPPLMVAEALTLGLKAPLAAVAIAAVFSGCAMGLQGVVFQTTMQKAVPGEVLGRVAAFDLVASEVGQPVGYALAGPLGLAFGVRGLLIACAVVAATGSALFAGFISTARQPDLDEEGEDGESQPQSTTVPAAHPVTPLGDASAG
ncbi:MFS transporter [Catenulispora pinisilvae]|uniref:MFS transporter n=1 Tax=Catenulispora pinisilvae TaxID=2705253 RepID=UPI001891B7CF|nr:MFS transporter [Catenulispora pinisilvae]